MPEHQIYAVKYAGPFTSSGALLMWLKDWEKVVKRNYYIWYLEGTGGPVIVDAGVSPQLAGEKNLAGYVNPAEVLLRIGIKADEVQHVVITHMHWDHSSGASLFPKAIFYVQKEEYRFWLKDPIVSYLPFKQFSDDASNAYLASLEGTGRLVLLNGEQEILPGIRCLLAPGHSVALQAVAVETAKGIAILGSDCAHTFRNYRENWPSSFIMDLVAWVRTYDMLREKASSIDLMFPGHDAMMSENYPEVAKDITKLV